METSNTDPLYDYQIDIELCDLLVHEHLYIIPHHHRHINIKQRYSRGEIHHAPSSNPLRPTRRCILTQTPFQCNHSAYAKLIYAYLTLGRYACG